MEAAALATGLWQRKWRGGENISVPTAKREKVQRATINCAPYDVRNTKALTKHFSLYFLGLLYHAIL